MREDQPLHVNLLTGREEASNNDRLLVLKRTRKKRSFDPPRTIYSQDHLGSHDLVGHVTPGHVTPTNSLMNSSMKY
jgi:hypothetical protein